MKKIVPTVFCDTLNYCETDIKYLVDNISFKTTSRGCLIEFPVEYGEEIFGFGLQLKALIIRATNSN